MNTRIEDWKKMVELTLGVWLAWVGSLQATQLVTVPDPARPPAIGGNGDSSTPLITPDGRFVLFTSSAGTLVASNAALQTAFPPRLNVFLRDRSNAVTTLVSVNVAGNAGGDGDSIAAGISTNGRFALIESRAGDLFASDTNGACDVLVRDLLGGTNILVSVATNGLPGNGDSRSAVMTPDGRFVAFVSAANNLVAGDTNGVPDVFVRDLQSGVTTLASVGATYGGSEAPEITPDGRYVAFYSIAKNLVPGVPIGGDIYVRDLIAGSTIWVSSYARTALQSVYGTTNAVSFSHVISADGRFVAYEVSQNSSLTNGIVLRYSFDSGLTDIVHTNAAVTPGAPEDIWMLAMTPDGRFIAFVANTNTAAGPASCVYVWDALSGTSRLASGDLSGAVGANSLCAWPALTPDGHFVAFNSSATNLVTNSLTGEFHLYVRDLQAGVTTLVDAGTNGIGSGVTPVTLPRLSDDGRYVAFEAPDGNLVPNDSNKSTDVFVRDLIAAATELISTHDPALPSVTPSGPSTLSPLSVSAEGSFVAFASEADDLVPNDTNGFRDVFVRDLLADRTLLVSADTSGVTPGNGLSSEPVISADGRYVAFTSSAANLVAGDTNGVSDVFVRDLLTETTVLVSVNTAGFSGNRASYSPLISADGQAVLFHSKASDLAPGSFGSSIENLFFRKLSANTTFAITKYTSLSHTLPAAMTPSGRFVVFGGQSSKWYIWDSQTATLVSTNSAALTGVGISPDGNWIAYVSGTSLYLLDRAANSNRLLGVTRSPSHVGLRFSADSRFLAYATTSSNAPADTNSLCDVYLYDSQAGSNILVSRAYSAPAAANGDSDSPDISADGRFVAYRSAASNLVPGDTNGVPDIFLWDRTTGVTMLLSVGRSTNATADNRSLTPVFSGDGTTVVFESWASDIAALDFNRQSDLFAFSLLSFGPIPVFRATIVPGADSSQGVWVCWPVIPGKSYRVQFKNSLADADWQDVTGGVTLVGTQGFLNDPNPTTGQRFYRIVAQ
jgi:Tol biopolymer transport system component